MCCEENLVGEYTRSRQYCYFFKGEEHLCMFKWWSEETFREGNIRSKTQKRKDLMDQRPLSGQQQNGAESRGRYWEERMAGGSGGKWRWITLVAFFFFKPWH